MNRGLEGHSVLDDSWIEVQTLRENDLIAYRQSLLLK